MNKNCDSISSGRNSEICHRDGFGRFSLLIVVLTAELNPKEVP